MSRIEAVDSGRTSEAARLPAAAQSRLGRTPNLMRVLATAPVPALLPRPA